MNLAKQLDGDATQTAPKIAGPTIAVVIPCFRETANILATLEKMPDLVSRVYCIDDACPDGTGDYIQRHNTDPRVEVLRQQKNTGVGGATITGYRKALADGADIIVKIDGDGQMDPRSIPRFVRPIIEGRTDYTKGNRFFLLENLSPMPKVRIFGNAALSFLSKLSAGYWRIFDPTNGYTAIHAKVLALLPLDKLHKGYFFESDMLYRLSTIRAVVIDVPERAIYNGEQSHLRIGKVMPVFCYRHLRNFLARIFYGYFLRDFHLASIEWVAGPLLMLFGFVFGVVNWQAGVSSHSQATAGTVMLAGLPVIVGLQLLLSAIGFDIDNQPEIPLHHQL